MKSEMHEYIMASTPDEAAFMKDHRLFPEPKVGSQFGNSAL
jgi:hypothetical protein